MSYTYQTGWGVRDGDEWKDDAWVNNSVYESLETAIKRLRHSSNLSRVCCPLRIIDETGKVYALYDPEEDMRLPGCRWRATERESKALWEAAGRPEGRDEEFWLKAESELLAAMEEAHLSDSIGITIY